jgi:hypothetical protein
MAKSTKNYPYHEKFPEYLMGSVKSNGSSD